jgi:peptide-methionine (R)-S-oxide reductase
LKELEVHMTRRILLRGLLSAAVSTLFHRTLYSASASDMSRIQQMQANWKSLLAAGAKAPLATEPFKLSKEEWRKRLTAAQFDILRDEGTEPAGSSPLNEEKRAGIFACAGCDLPLFTSEMKYESGTGWPSFFTTIPGVFATSTDFKLILPRTEYHCIRCGGHHGHVFKDGPPPTGQRWCNNGVALKFIPKAGKV